eukprot:gnl/TRDRNA2_/TRDRNA2_87280_c0_seq1.p1 gnl/TRDRNA2_/TRDRNA2_87280_c0~~gnl/TRDRNA2_/TRDRNA2_87280_c0_seq1.p1  ORF type:complete len:320 (+),score=53.84 gnl/TRDRNA2_/TRDRNA2_87280_c0_seq1:51-1010(+)
MAPGRSITAVIPEGLFDCGVCARLLLDPVTLSCCGKAFCRECLKICLKKGVLQSGVPRCPAGCGGKLPFRLPPRSEALHETIQILMPEEEVNERRDEEDEPEPIPGGFAALEEVAASQDLKIGDVTAVAFGMSGVIVGPSAVEGRVLVKFDARMDIDIDRPAQCLDVQPFEIMRQLPPQKFGELRIGQRVCASMDLVSGPTLVVRFATSGVILRQFNEDRVAVQFDERADGVAGPLSVQPFEIQPARALAGGFRLANRVSAAKDLFAENTLLVPCGSLGVVKGPYSDTRITVKFDDREVPVNVVPAEIRLVSGEPGVHP